MDFFAEKLARTDRSLSTESSMGNSAREPSRSLRLSGGRIVKTSAVYDTYWAFAARRQEIFMKRALGNPAPWTDDPVLLKHRFTNAYRAADRVSQFLIREVLYSGPQQLEEVFFRTLLFKLFNRIDTWGGLVAAIEQPSWRKFDYERYAAALDRMMEAGRRVYSAAYIMPSPPFGSERKHRNHLHLLEHMMRDGAPKKFARAKSLADAFNVIRGYPSLGDFLAFQFTIDLNYSSITEFSEMDFVVAGPGARDGIRKCFTDTGGLSDSDVIRLMADRATEEFQARNLAFQTLWGRRLQLIDCQNLFCEVDKYARVVHPESRGDSGRSRIKQLFRPAAAPVPQWYPPKWNLDLPPELAAGHPGGARVRLTA